MISNAPNFIYQMVLICFYDKLSYAGVTIKCNNFD